MEVPRINPMITQWILFIVTFLIGYTVGHSKGAYPSTQELQQEIQKRINPTGERVGLVKRPTAKDISKRNNPKADEEEEMTKMFGQYPELKV